MSDILNTLLGEFDSEDGGISGADLHHLAFLLVKERKDLQDKLKIAVEILDDIFMEIGIITDDPSGHMEQNLERAKKFLKEYAAVCICDEINARNCPVHQIE